MNLETSFWIFLALTIVLILLVSVAVSTGYISRAAPVACILTIFGALLFTVIWGIATMKEAHADPSSEIDDDLRTSGWCAVFFGCFFAVGAYIVFAGGYCMEKPSLCCIGSCSLFLVSSLAMVIIVPGLITLLLAKSHLMTAEKYSELTMLSTDFEIEYRKFMRFCGLEDIHECHGYIGRRKVEWGHSWACPQHPLLWCSASITETDCNVATHQINRVNGKAFDDNIVPIRNNTVAIAMVQKCLQSKTVTDISPETGQVVDMKSAFGNCPSDPSDCSAKLWIPDELGRDMEQEGKMLAIVGAALIAGILLVAIGTRVQKAFLDRPTRTEAVAKDENDDSSETTSV